ncbi:hypothetical protein CRYUN_Cryun02cG0014800 [Craigia yunnanensis]
MASLQNPCFSSSNILPKVCGELTKLLISDFWIQSCWRKSEVLSLISSCCYGLMELELKNAWLSVDGLNPMTRLTNLTLEFIGLEDEDLNKVNDCFPSLRVLNLVGVGGLKDPKIHLLHLKSCLWTVSNAPLSLTIFVPNLVKLRLKCIKPKSLVLDTPLLSDFHLSVEEAYDFRVKEFCNLENLQLESSSLHSLLGLFPSGPGAWSEADICFRKGGLEDRNAMELTEIVADLVVYDIKVTLSFIYSILDKCTNLSDMALLLHPKEDSRAASSLISRCTTYPPRIKWSWGIWKEGSKYDWYEDISDYMTCTNEYGCLESESILDYSISDMSGLLQPTLHSLLHHDCVALINVHSVNKMATVPGQLIWEIVKKNNCFLVKEFGRGNAGVQFSKESNNLYNLNSYKHSGLANKKTVTIQSGGKDQSVLLATSKTKKQNKPASLLHISVMRKEFPRMAKAVVNQVADNYYRPDLKKAALAKLSAVHRSLKVAKSGVKKRNRQAVRIRGRN